MHYYIVTITFKGEMFWFLAVALGDAVTCSVMFLISDRVYTIKLVGYLCFASVIFTILGWILYEHGYPGTINNNLGLAVMVAQLLAMTWRLLYNDGILHRIIAYIDGNRLLRFVSGNSDKRHKEVQSSRPKKEIGRCQEK
ncbi:MAG TPA: hypothetical protein EYO58_12425 [Flavobacteriales bacterium]|nr:hypothetical protein [Flavobacteriales bacterium]